MFDKSYLSLWQVNPKFLPVAYNFCLTLTCNGRGFAWTAFLMFCVHTLPSPVLTRTSIPYTSCTSNSHFSCSFLKVIENKTSTKSKADCDYDFISQITCLSVCGTISKFHRLINMCLNKLDMCCLQKNNVDPLWPLIIRHMCHTVKFV